MYTIDKRDQVFRIWDAPRSCVGAPIPVVVSDEHSVLLAYLIDDAKPQLEGGGYDFDDVQLVSMSTEGRSVAVIEFDDPVSHYFGAPNDEAFSGHPLYNRGLEHYAIMEVHDSSWIRALEKMNSVHPEHVSGWYNDCRHYIFAFHDSVFECVARGFKARVARNSSISSVFPRLVEMILAKDR